MKKSHSIMFDIVFWLWFITIIFCGATIIFYELQTPTPDSSQIKQKKDIDINQIAIDNFNRLKPPIILLAKDKTMGCWGVVLIDSTKKIVPIGNLTSLGNSLGDSYKRGDTIVK